MTTDTVIENTNASLLEKYGDKPSGVEKAGYTMFFLGQNIIFGIMLAAIQTFWQFTLAIPLEVIGIIFLVARVWDGINDPILGYIVQKTPQSRWGKYKPWSFATAFALPFVVMLAFVNVNPGIDGVEGATATFPVMVYAAVTYLIYGMVYTICDAPAFALATTMEPDTKRRSQIIMWGRVGAGIAGLFTSSLFWIIQGKVGGHQSFLIATASMMAIAMFTMAMIALTKERNIIPSSQPVTIKSTGKFIGQNKHIQKLVVGKTVAALASAFLYGTVTVIILSGLFGATEENEMASGQITLVFTMGSIIAFLLPFIVGPLIKKNGKRKTAMIMGVVGTLIVTTFGVATLLTENIWYYCGFHVGSMLIATTSVMIAFTYTPDCIEYGAYKTGIRQVVVGQTVSSFTAKMDMGIAGFVSTWVLAAVGVASGADAMYNAEAMDSARTVLFIAVIAIILAGVTLFTMWGMWWNLNREDVLLAAQHNGKGTSDPELDFRLGIDRKADTNLKNAKDNLQEAEEKLDPADGETIAKYEEARNQVRYAKVAHKSAYKKLNKERKAKKSLIKEQRKAAIKG